MDKAEGRVRYMMESSSTGAEVARLFFEVSKNLKQCAHKSFEDVGITIPQSMVIRTLINFGEMKITELSSKVNLSNSTVSAIVDRLEKQDLVMRRRSEEDRRIVFVNVTAKVEELYKGIHREIEKNFEELLSAGTTEDMEKIIEGLNTLKRVLNHKNDKNQKMNKQ